jgi:hypothetical protein
VFSPSSRATTCKALDPEMRHRATVASPLALRSTIEARGLSRDGMVGKNSSQISPRPRHRSAPHPSKSPKVRNPIPLSVATKLHTQSPCPTLSLCCTPQHATPSAAGSAKINPEQLLPSSETRAGYSHSKGCLSVEAARSSNKLSITVHTQDLDQHRKFKWQLGL